MKSVIKNQASRHPEANLCPMTLMGVGSCSILSRADCCFSALYIYKLQTMVYTFVNISFGLRLKAFNDGLLLIKLSLVYQTLKLELSEPFLDLAEWQLYSVELRTVRDYEYPRYAQLPHPILHRSRLMRSQVVHHNGQTLARVDLGKSFEESDKVFLIDCLIIESEALETASFTDCCKNSRVFSTKGLAWQVEVLLAPTPLVLGIRLLGEHGLIEPYNFPLLVIGLLQPFFHRFKQWCVPTILGLYWHLGDVDDLLFDQVLLVDEAQAPGLDKLVGELSMKQ